MIELICFCFPAVISINILSKLDNTMSLEKKVFQYFVYNLLINIAALLVIGFLNNFQVLYIDKLFTITFSLKYLLLATVIAVILPIVIYFITSNIKIKFKRVK